MQRLLMFMLWSAWLAALVLPTAGAAEPRGAGARTNHHERVVTHTGRVFEGLIESDDPQGVLVLQFHRPPGAAAFAVGHWISRQRIASIQRLTPAARASLVAEARRLRERAQIEAGRLEDVSLKADAGQDGWEYAGPWFQLKSTAGEETTRRVVVRLEQIFTAYRRLATPETHPPAKSPLEVRVFGSREEYDKFLRDLGARLKNPSVFMPEQNMLAVGGDFRRLWTELAAARKQSQRVEEQLAAKRRAIPKRRREASAELKRAGRSASEIRDYLRRLSSKLDAEIDQRQRNLDARQRRNVALLEQQSERLTARLYHEAFHAYIENFVYPRAASDIPRWLNEGLAQVFEAGLVEGANLRLDAPLREALTRLRADLRDTPLPLAKLLTADSRAFLVAHEDSAATSARHYAYAWGLAYYLCFEKHILGSARLDRYVGAESSALPAVQRFEQLIGEPLEKFEPRWRSYMLKLK